MCAVPAATTLFLAQASSHPRLLAPPKTVKPEDRKTRLRRREMCTAPTICAQNMQKRAPHLSNQSYTPPSRPT